MLRLGRVIILVSGHSDDLDGLTSTNADARADLGRVVRGLVFEQGHRRRVLPVAVEDQATGRRILQGLDSGGKCSEFGWESINFGFGRSLQLNDAPRALDSVDLVGQIAKSCLNAFDGGDAGVDGVNAIAGFVDVFPVFTGDVGSCGVGEAEETEGSEGLDKGFHRFAD